MDGIGTTVAPADEMAVGLGCCLDGYAGAIGIDAATSDGAEGGVGRDYGEGVLVVDPVNAEGDGLSGKECGHDKDSRIHTEGGVKETQIEGPAAEGVSIVGSSGGNDGVTNVVLIGAGVGNDGALEGLVVDHGNGERIDLEVGSDVKVHASHVGHNFLTDGVGLEGVGIEAQVDNPVGEGVAGSSDSLQGDGVAHIVTIGARSWDGGAHGGVSSGHGDGGGRRRQDALATNEMVDGDVGGGSAAGNGANLIG